MSRTSRVPTLLKPIGIIFPDEAGTSPLDTGFPFDRRGTFIGASK